MVWEQLAGVVVSVLGSLALVGIGVWRFVKSISSKSKELGKNEHAAEDAKAEAKFWRTMSETDKVASMEEARRRAAARRLRRLRNQGEAGSGGSDLPGAS